MQINSKMDGTVQARREFAHAYDRPEATQTGEAGLVRGVAMIPRCRTD